MIYVFSKPDLLALRFILRRGRELHLFVDPEHYLGNISNDKLFYLLNSDNQHILGDKKALLTGQCLNCPWLAHCHGRCFNSP